MSIQAVGWVLDHSEAIGNDRLVMISLANHTDEHRVCWPSVDTICREARVSRATTFRSLDRLREAGELVRVDNSQLSPQQRERYERLRPDRRPIVYQLTGCQSDTPLGHGVSNEGVRGLTNGGYGVSLVRPESSLNRKRTAPTFSERKRARDEVTNILTSTLRGGKRDEGTR